MTEKKKDNAVERKKIKDKEKLEKVKAQKKEEKKSGHGSKSIDVTMTNDEFADYQKYIGKKNRAVDANIPAFKVIVNETPEMLEIFEFWYNSAEEEARSINEVAKQFNKSRRTIRNYMYSFDWLGRREDRISKIKGDITTRSEQGEINSINTYRQMFRKLTDRALEDINDGYLKIRSIKDLQAIAELELRILEEDRHASSKAEVEEGKLGSLVDVLRNMPATADPRATITIEEKTTTISNKPAEVEDGGIIG